MSKEEDSFLKKKSYPKPKFPLVSMELWPTWREEDKII